MATYSELMKLTLPDRTDKYKIEDFNQNFTKIDTKVAEAAATTATLVTAEETARKAAISAEMLKLRKRNDMGISSRFLSERYVVQSNKGYPSDCYIDGLINLSGIENPHPHLDLMNGGARLSLYNFEARQVITVNKSFPLYFSRLNIVTMLGLRPNVFLKLEISFNNGQSWLTPQKVSDTVNPFTENWDHLLMYQLNDLSRTNSVKVRMTFSSTESNTSAEIYGIGFYPDEIE